MSREIAHREIAHKILGLFGAVSAGIRGILGVEVGRRCLQRFDEDRQAFLRLIRAHRFLLPPIPHLLFRLKVSIPGIVGVTIKVIVVHGELREMIPDVSGRWDMGLGDPVVFAFFSLSPGDPAKCGTSGFFHQLYRKLHFFKFSIKFQSLANEDRNAVN